jgi:hypothetical protein
MSKKAEKIFVRLGLEDIVIEMNESYDPEADTDLEDVNAYFIGYEDEEGNECEEDGTYLN